MRRLAGPLLMIVLAACAPFGPRATNERSARPSFSPSDPAPHHSNDPILVLGDSLTVGARDYGALESVLTDDGWVPEIVADHGRQVPWATARVLERDAVPRDVVVALGTNPGPSVRDLEREVEDLLVALKQRGARRVLWVPPQASDDRYDERVAVLEAFARARRLRLSGWGPSLLERPEWMHTDGVHLSAGGYTALATHIRDALNA